MDSLTILALKKAESGGGGDITVESLSVSQNGEYTATTGKAYSPVTVAVPQTTVSSLSVTENGTYTATEGTAYSPVTVNVPSSGGSSYELKYTTSFTISTTSTTSTDVATVETGVEFKTPSKFLLVCIYDTAGRRNGYFYGSITLLEMYNSWTSTDTKIHKIFRTNNDGTASTNTQLAGLFITRFYADGKFKIKVIYNADNSGTIDGTYKVDVYFADYPTGFSPIA